MVTLESLIWNSCILGDTVGGCLSHAWMKEGLSALAHSKVRLLCRWTVCPPGILGGRVHGAHKPDVRHWWAKALGSVREVWGGGAGINAWIPRGRALFCIQGIAGRQHSARASAESVHRIPERILWHISFKRWARRAPMPSSDSNCPTQGLRCDGDWWSLVVLCHIGRACCRQSWDSGRSCNLEWKSLAVI